MSYSCFIPWHKKISTLFVNLEDSVKHWKNIFSVSSSFSKGFLRSKKEKKVSSFIYTEKYVIIFIIVLKSFTRSSLNGISIVSSVE